MRKGYERVRADISLDAILANMESMKRNLKEGVQITAVLKTNAYGHGAGEDEYPSCRISGRHAGTAVRGGKSCRKED